MKQILLALTIVLSHLIGYAQLHDTTLAKKLTINGYCVCELTLSDLKQSNLGLKEVAVEEMDLPSNCYGQDSRYIAGKGYSLDSQPGVIFQKEQDSDYISKIRLTREFRGKLPNGSYVDLNKFLLKDMFKLYPSFKDKWGSRDCSKYWKFSNDTISFYVKIDTTKKPQFPIDEKSYLDKPVEAIDLIMSCRAVHRYDDGYHYGETHHKPLIFLDSVKVTLDEVNPDDIASLTVWKDSNALKKFGPEGKNGVIFIESKKYARAVYWKYLSSKSPEYAKIVTNPDNDTFVQYILNGNVLKTNFESELSSLNDKTFKEVKILTKEQLIKNYQIADKDYGIDITSYDSKSPKPIEIILKGN